MKEENAIGVSLIVPTRNEEKIVEKNLKLIHDYISRTFDKFEILVCDYSTDCTPKIVQALSRKYQNIKYVSVYKKGIGIGMRTGMLAAGYNLLMVYPIDISWGLDSIGNSFSVLISGRADIALGSREHAESVCNRPFKRRIFSKLYNILINFLFDLQIKDTQCVIALKKSDVLGFIDRLDSDNPIFQTQILIYAKRAGLKIVEIPVVVNDVRKDSKVNLIRDGIVMFGALIKEYLAFRKYK